MATAPAVDDGTTDREPSPAGLYVSLEPPLGKPSRGQTGDSGLSEFAQLKQTLVVGTLLFALGLTVVVTVVWSLRTGLSFGLGGAVGALYLRLLAKSVERTPSGGWQLPLGSARMVVFVGLMVVALKTEALAALPAFFGFLTYKAFLLVYAICLASKS
ncbi:MAG: ATP synthase subunit I [Pseudanabaenaceae cyanobacterium]